MNKVYRFVILILALSGLLFLGQKALNEDLSDKDKKNIYFYNWGDYIDPEILRDFEKEYGYQVIYETFDSNEAMMAKIEQATTSYDLAFPSDYTVEMMRNKNLLKELDHSKLKNLENIDKRFLDRSFDPKNKYSVPYFWGSFGIVYNKNKYEESDFSKWEKLWDRVYEGEILAFDGARETMAIGLWANGLSPNTKDEKTLRSVKSDLVPLMKNVKAFLADEIRMYLVRGEADIGLTFSGEAAMAQEENDELSYVIPEEGSNIWFDNIVIPKTSENTKGAYELINYLLRPDIAARNADYVCYPTPNKKALDLIDPGLRANKTLYPDDKTIKNLEIFKDLGKETNILYNDLFLDLKISPKAE